MIYKYYNDNGYKKAMSTIETDPYTCANRLREYLDNYPLDYTAYPYYISVLILIGDFNTAREKLDFIENILNSGFYKYDEKRNNILKYAFLFSKFKLLCCEGKYKEAYNLYMKDKNTTKEFDVDKILFFCKAKLGLLNEEQERDTLPYFYRQTVDYQENDFLHHAKKHCADTPYRNKNDQTIFVSGFPIEEVFSEVKKYIPSNKKMYPGFVDNMYFFKYDRCGICDTGTIDYFKVITFDNTNNIITMYPFSDGAKLPYVDLNYMLVKNDSKVKKLSQIEKFNRKYGLK